MSESVTISVRSGLDGVVVEDPTRKLFGWEHRTFFTVVMGFEADESLGRYVASGGTQTPRILREITEYLGSQSVPFETDAAAQSVLVKWDADQKSFRASAKEGYRALTVPPRQLQIPGFARQLKPYQAQGTMHMLAVRHGANFSVPGSGKTTVVYAAYSLLRGQDAIDKMLVVGPRSSFRPWEDEAVACFDSPPEIRRLTGPVKTRKSIYHNVRDCDILLCTYQTMANDVQVLQHVLGSYRFLVVVDESHNVKRFAGGKWAEALLDIAPHAAKRIVLTGTPAPNSYEDLWTQFTFLWPGEQVLGDRESYKLRCDDPEGGPGITKDIRPFFFRVPKSRLKLPPVEYRRISCELKPIQAQIYRNLAAKYLSELELGPEDRSALRNWRRAKMIRLVQTASNPALLVKRSETFQMEPLSGLGLSVVELIKRYPEFEVPTKIEAGIKLVRQLLKQQSKVVVWSTFIHNIATFATLLDDVPVYQVFGAIPKDENENVEFNREQQIQAFKEHESACVLLANPAACAESVSLHRACHDAVYLDRTFNCGQFMQSLDRIHRLGLAADAKVRYHLLLAKDSIDETIDRRLEEKRARMVRLLEDDLPLGALGAEDDEIQPTDREIEHDFEATMQDLTRQAAKRDSNG